MSVGQFVIVQRATKVQYDMFLKFDYPESDLSVLEQVIIKNRLAYCVGLGIFMVSCCFSFFGNYI